MSGGDLLEMTLVEAGSAIRARDVSSCELTSAVLNRIDQLDRNLHCFITVDVEAALVAADRADVDIARGRWRGYLHGVPLALKDIFDRTGCVTTAGSRIPNRPAIGTATVLSRLQSAGAIIIGALNMDEFAAGGTGANPHFGRCRNPWRTDYITGGSSCGSAAASAARMVFGSLGADTGGSIRLPASMCGVVGLKPTYGRISRAGSTARSWSVDCVGPMARTAEDCAVIFEAVAGTDPADPTTSPLPISALPSFTSTDLVGLRIGLASGEWFSEISCEIEDLMREACDVFRDLGAQVVEVCIPDLELLTDLQQIIVKCEAATIMGGTLRHRPNEISWPVRSILYEGFFITAPRYLEALSMRASLLERHVNDVFRDVDIVLAPVTAEPVPRFDAMQTRTEAEQESKFSDSARFTRFSNYLGTPSLAVPCGFTSNGLPAGFQLLGCPFSEGELLSAAHAYLRSTRWHQRHPRLTDHC